MDHLDSLWTIWATFGPFGLPHQMTEGSHLGHDGFTAVSLLRLLVVSVQL